MALSAGAVVLYRSFGYVHNARVIVGRCERVLGVGLSQFGTCLSAQSIHFFLAPFEPPFARQVARCAWGNWPPRPVPLGPLPVVVPAWPREEFEERDDRFTAARPSLVSRLASFFGLCSVRFCVHLSAHLALGQGVHLPGWRWQRAAGNLQNCGRREREALTGEQLPS